MPLVLVNEIVGRVERDHVTMTLFADMTKRKHRCSGHAHGEAQPPSWGFGQSSRRVPLCIDMIVVLCVCLWQSKRLSMIC